jgi:hypothetical protein
MARQIITVPRQLCRVSAFDWDIDWRNQPGGEATNGNTMVMSAGFPRWVGTMPLVLPPSLVLAWRAVRAHARGRMGLYLITMIDSLAPYPADGQPWANGEPWANDENWEGDPVWLFAVAALRGASTIRVTIPAGMPDPIQGQIVSHEHWPTIITSVEKDGAQWVLTIARPLIVDAGLGNSLSLRPTGIFEAVSDVTGNPTYGLGRVSRPVMELREYLNR